VPRRDPVERERREDRRDERLARRVEHAERLTRARWDRGGPAWARHAPPPWWPAGEPWPPQRPPWQRMGEERRFRRRRFFGALVVLVAVLVGTGVVIGAVASAVGDGRGGRGPWPAFGLLVMGTVVFAVTWLVTRRVARPVRALLEAAREVAAGDYSAHVVPRGPRELREFGATFNEMAAGLATAEDQRRRFLADVSHELRTPLTVLQTGIEAQLDGMHPRDDAHLTSLLDETRLLGRLIDDLHTQALAEAGRLALHVEPSDPALVASDAVDAHAASAAAKGVDLTLHVADAVPTVELDGDRVRQVLSNLLANAIRHTPAGGHVRVDVGAEDAGVRVAVVDDGPGMAPEQLARVFDRFTKAADSGGSGLGLSIARDLVAAHGGTLTATSTLGEGTTMVVRLPAVAGTTPG
jgi:two-component system, OmpR family, sensor histidine kinase BaeS